MRATKLQNFIEKKIWENFLVDSDLKPDKDFKFLCLQLDHKKFKLKEVVFQDYFRVDK